MKREMKANVIKEINERWSGGVFHCLVLGSNSVTVNSVMNVQLWLYLT
jgi:hypothetical protein